MKDKGLLSNFSWRFAERISAQLVSTVVSIVLARILDPDHYGLISMVMVCINLANVLVSNGLASALIQKKDSDALDFSSFLYFNVAVSALLYVVLFLIAPWIAAFYGPGYEILTPILRVMGLQVIITSVNSIQFAYVSKKMMFKKVFWATMAGTVFSAVTGIALAYAGFGVWALVIHSLAGSLAQVIVTAFVIRKLPVLAFSFKRVKVLLSFGVKVLGAGMLSMGFQELQILLIARTHSSANLAFYDKGSYFPKLITNNYYNSVTAVLFPKMSNDQDDIQKVRNTTKQAIRVSCFAVFPLLLGMAAVAKTMIPVILTEKWLPAVPLVQVFCIYYLLQPVHAAHMQAIKALGKGNTYLRLEFIKKAFEILAFIITVQISLYAVALSAALLATAFVFLNGYPNIKLLNYSFKEQVMDMAPAFLCSCFMMLVVVLVGLLPMHGVLMLIVQVCAGIISYLAAALITRNKELQWLLSKIKAVFHKGK